MTTAPSAGIPATVAVNVLGVVEHPGMTNPYNVDSDGRPYVPTGDGGIVLGLRLGESVFARDADHAAPGACLAHPDPAARLALTGYACIGNPAVVRSGPVAGAPGVVLGKRGESGRVIVLFRQDDLARLRPGDQVSIRAEGQGARFFDGVSVLNVAPDLLQRLPISIGDGAVTAQVHAVLPSRLVGNGLGRPAHLWDLDLQLTPEELARHGTSDLRLGDLVAITDLDSRYNVGYRKAWTTIGVVVHGASRLPGHGPGVTPILTGSAAALLAHPTARPHPALSEQILGVGA